MRPEGLIRAAAMQIDDWTALKTLPWGAPLETWNDAKLHVNIIEQRRGMSRHPVLFVRTGTRKYAIKETSPEAATEEIAAYREIARRGCTTLTPVGSVIVVGDLIPAGKISGVEQYISGDVGYCITRLATRVLPQSLLYQYPFTVQNKQKLLIAIARLLATMHDAGVYWGDASLANVLVDLSRRRLLAVMADAETAQIFPAPLSEMLRQSDVDFFIEALAWQSEDIRLARDLPEDETVLNEGDAQFFQQMYDSMRRPGSLHPLSRDIESAFVQLGGGVLDLGVWARNASMAGIEATLRPGWYRDQLRDLVGIWVPRAYARRLYELLLGHKWLMSEAAGHEVGMAEVSADWRERYHDPLDKLLRTYAPGKPLDYDRYLAIMHHIWLLSQREGHPIPIEEGAIDYLLPSRA